MQLQSLLSFAATPAPGAGTGPMVAATPAGAFGGIVEDMVRSLGAGLVKPAGPQQAGELASPGLSTDDAVLAGLMQAMGLVAQPMQPTPLASDLSVSGVVAGTPAGGDGTTLPLLGAGEVATGMLQPDLRPVLTGATPGMPDSGGVSGAAPVAAGSGPGGPASGVAESGGGDAADAAIVVTIPDMITVSGLPAVVAAQAVSAPPATPPQPAATALRTDATSQPIIPLPANEPPGDKGTGPDRRETPDGMNTAVTGGVKSPKPIAAVEFRPPITRLASAHGASGDAVAPAIDAVPLPSGGTAPPLLMTPAVADSLQVVPRDQPPHAVLASRHATGAQGGAGLQLVGRIEQAIAKEQTTLTVQLDPEHLGRVEVKLELQDGRVTAMIAAEKPATLDLLQRDARLIERTLQQGGMQVQPDGLHFSLREGGGQWTMSEQGRRGAQLYGQQALAAPRPDPLTPVLYRTDSLVDIQI